jgi:hypothetical protein
MEFGIKQPGKEKKMLVSLSHAKKREIQFCLCRSCCWKPWTAVAGQGKDMWMDMQLLMTSH